MNKSDAPRPGVATLLAGQFLPIWEVTGRAEVTLLGKNYALNGRVVTPLPGVSDWSRGPYRPSSTGVSVVTWTILAVINRCSRPYPLLGSLTPGGCQIGLMDHTGCRQLNRVLTHNKNAVKSASTLRNGREESSNAGASTMYNLVEGVQEMWKHGGALYELNPGDP
jgi:hypothetical protein